MFSFLPEDLRAALDMARQQERRRKARLSILADERRFPVLRMTARGFSLPADAPHLRGLVDLYEGSRHIAQCLVIASEEGEGEMRYEYKRRTAATDRPALDFARPEDAPAGLLPGY